MGIRLILHEEQLAALDVTLFEAAFAGLTGVVRRLLATGRLVNERDDALWTPLTYAAYGGHVDTVRELLKAGADVELGAPGITPLCWAARAGNLDVVQILVSAGADVDQVDPSGSTALSEAVDRHDWHAVALLADPLGSRPASASISPPTRCRSASASLP